MLVNESVKSTILCCYIDLIDSHEWRNTHNYTIKIKKFHFAKLSKRPLAVSLTIVCLDLYSLNKSIRYTIEYSFNVDSTLCNLKN